MRPRTTTTVAHSRPVPSWTPWGHGSLRVERRDVPLNHVAVEVVPDGRLIRAVVAARLFEMGFVSPQPFLPDLGEVE